MRLPLLLLLGLWIGQSSAQQPRIAFPFTQGWEGADAAYSIQLSADRYLWLFGDTFVGPPNDAQRKHILAMPRNSIGIADCPPEKPCKLRYFWSKMGTNMPRAFFDTGTEEWFWPLDGFVWKDKLYILLSRFEAKGEGAFGFQNIGVTLATIANFHSSPAQWKIQYQPILASTLVMPGNSIVVRGEYVNCFTFVDQHGTRYTALTRLPLKELKNAALSNGHWQYLSADGSWKAWKTGTLPDDTKHVMSAGYTEFTVRYHPAEKCWLAVMPANILEGRGLYSTAPAFEGPWSEPQTLYRYPEMQPGNANYTKNVFCYADKEHPELESSGSLVFTYACNSFVLNEVTTNPKLYYPMVVTMPMAQIHLQIETK
jgi:hypothetical protein